MTDIKSGISYIREFYRVPAFRGGRVRTSTRGEGRITGTYKAWLMVRPDNERKSFPFHPASVEYLEVK